MSAPRIILASLPSFC